MASAVLPAEENVLLAADQVADQELFSAISLALALIEQVQQALYQVMYLVLSKEEDRPGDD